MNSDYITCDGCGVVLDESNMIANTNPADALAELLIWAKGQEVV